MAVDWNAEAANEPEVRGKVARLERKPALLPRAPKPARHGLWTLPAASPTP